MTWLTLSAAWVIPPGADYHDHDGTVLAPAGDLWDVVRTPAALGREVLARLLADPADAPFVGPVVLDDVGAWMYWLIATGATDTYPPGCTLLTAGSWVTLPQYTDGRARVAYWAHLPEHRTLSGPAWLAAALDTKDQP